MEKFKKYRPFSFALIIISMWLHFLFWNTNESYIVRVSVCFILMCCTFLAIIDLICFFFIPAVNKKSTKELTIELVKRLQEDRSGHHECREASYYIEIEPMQVRTHLHKGAVCDNNRRKSKCANEAQVCVSNRTVEIQVSGEDHQHYHVCHACAGIAIKNNKQMEGL